MNAIFCFMSTSTRYQTSREQLSSRVHQLLFFFLLSVMTNDRKGWQALDNVMTVEFNTVYTSWGKAVFTNKNKIKQLQYNRMHDLRLEATPKYVLNYCSLLRGRFNSLFSTKFIKAYWLHSINSKPTEKTRKVYGIELGIA